MSENVVTKVRWTEPGWYAPRQEGFGWGTVIWEKVCDFDLEYHEANEAARWQGRGTPRQIASIEEARELE